jgi:phage-related protein
MANDIEITVRVANQTRAGLAGVARSMRDLRDEARDAGRAVDVLGARSGMAAVGVRRLDAAVRDLNQSMRNLRGSAGGTNQSLRVLGDRAQAAHGRLGDLSNQTRRLRSDSDDLDGSMRRLTGTMGGLRGSMGSLSVSSGRAGGGLGGLKAAAVLLAPLWSPITAAVGATASMMAAAGAAAGAFGLAVGGQLKRVAEVSDLYTKAQEAAAEGGEKAAEAQKAYKTALDKLPPATRDTARAFLGLKADYGKWSDAMSATTMPVFTKGIGVLRDMLPSLSPLVKAASAAFGDFVDGLGKGVAGGGFDRFVKRLADTAGVVLPDLLQAVRNVGRGLGGIIDAFLPEAGRMSESIKDVTDRFADWAQALKGSAGFDRFLEKAADGRETLKSLGTALMRIAETAARFADALAPVTGAVAGLIASMSPGMLQAIAAGWVAVKVAMWAVSATPIGLAVTALALLALGLVTAWKKSQTFREVVTTSMSLVTLPVLAFARITLGVLKGITTSFLTFAEGLLGLGAAAFSWVPGVGEKLEGAQEAVGRWKDANVGAFNGAIEKIEGWEDAVYNMPQEMRLKGDISDLEAKIADAEDMLSDKNLPKPERIRIEAEKKQLEKQLAAAKLHLKDFSKKKGTAALGASIGGVLGGVKRGRGELQNFSKKKGVAGLGAAIGDVLKGTKRGREELRDFSRRKGTAGLGAGIGGVLEGVRRGNQRLRDFSRRKGTAKLGVGIGGALRGVRQAQSAINSVVGRTVNVNVRFRATGSGAAQVASGFFASGGVVGGLRGFAHGGITGAASGGARGGMAWVGEQGPELVQLPFGSRVRSAGDSRRLMGGGGGGGGSRLVELVINLDGRTIARQIFDPLRGEVRDRGGIAALGT